MKVRKAIYAGTFDPLTNGHIDIIQRSLRTFDNLIVGVAADVTKNTMFSAEERVQMIQAVFSEEENIEIEQFSGLLVDYAKYKEANVLIRGIRAVSDFEYEFQMALMNRNLNKDIEVYFLMPNEKYIYLSSSLIKHVIKLGGDVGNLLPEPIIKKVKEKLRT